MVSVPRAPTHLPHLPHLAQLPLALHVCARPCGLSVRACAPCVWVRYRSGIDWRMTPPPEESTKRPPRVLDRPAAGSAAAAAGAVPQEPTTPTPTPLLSSALGASRSGSPAMAHTLPAHLPLSHSVCQHTCQVACVHTLLTGCVVRMCASNRGAGDAAHGPSSPQEPPREHHTPPVGCTRSRATRTRG